MLGIFDMCVVTAFIVSYFTSHCTLLYIVKYFVWSILLCTVFLKGDRQKRPCLFSNMVVILVQSSRVTGWKDQLESDE